MADVGGKEAAAKDPRARLRRLHEAFKTMMEKTIETLPFEDFQACFGQEFGEAHRDYLFDLYSTWVSRTRSNSEEEFGVLVFQADLEEKLAKLEELMASQPEGCGGVPLIATTPVQLARSARMEEKTKERERLTAILKELDDKNDLLQPVYQKLQVQASEGAAILRARKNEASAMLSASSAVLA